jgi:hypothetical protein
MFDEELFQKYISSIQEDSMDEVMVEGTTDNPSDELLL